MLEKHLDMKITVVCLSCLLQGSLSWTVEFAYLLHCISYLLQLRGNILQWQKNNACAESAACIGTDLALSCDLAQKHFHFPFWHIKLNLWLNFAKLNVDEVIWLLEPRSSYSIFRAKELHLWRNFLHRAYTSSFEFFF